MILFLQFIKNHDLLYNVLTFGFLLLFSWFRARGFAATAFRAGRHAAVAGLDALAATTPAPAVSHEDGDGRGGGVLPLGALVVSLRGQAGEPEGRRLLLGGLRLLVPRDELSSTTSRRGAALVGFPGSPLPPAGAEAARSPGLDEHGIGDARRRVEGCAAGGGSSCGSCLAGLGATLRSPVSARSPPEQWSGAPAVRPAVGAGRGSGVLPLAALVGLHGVDLRGHASEREARLVLVLRVVAGPRGGGVSGLAVAGLAGRGGGDGVHDKRGPWRRRAMASVLAVPWRRDWPALVDLLRLAWRAGVRSSQSHPISLAAPSPIPNLSCVLGFRIRLGNCLTESNSK